MFSSFFLSDILLWVYLAAACCYIFYMALKKEGIGHLAFALTIIGWIVNTATLIVRTIETGRAPYANLYETMILLSWLVVMGYIAIELKYSHKLRIVGAAIVTLAFLAMGAAAMLPYRDQRIGRRVRGWRGRKPAYFFIVGFLAVIFLYWGVSFVLPGLHAYA